jgi:hypothetical protein
VTDRKAPENFTAVPETGHEPSQAPPPVRRKRRKARRAAPIARRAEIFQGPPPAGPARQHADDPRDRYGPPPADQEPAPQLRPYSVRKGNGKLKKGEKPRLGLPDPLEAALEEALHFKEGNRKLALAVEALREGLELITVAEWDHRLNRPVSIDDQRRIAIGALDAYSAIVGQSWRRHRLSGPTRAGDRTLPENLEKEL